MSATRRNDAAEVRAALDRMADTLAAQLPPHIPVERFIGTVMTAVQKSPDLLTECDRASLFLACKEAAEDGLLPDGREGAIVRHKGRATWMPMIGGLVKLAWNCGGIASLHVDTAWEGETFEVHGGTNPHIVHVYNLGARKDGGSLDGVQAVYAVAKLATGETMQAVLTPCEVLKIKRVSRATNGPWKDWPVQMAQVRAARRLSKLLPLSSDRDADARMRRAVERGDVIDGVAEETNAAPSISAPEGGKLAALEQALTIDDRGIPDLDVPEPQPATANGAPAEEGSWMDSVPEPEPKPPQEVDRQSIRFRSDLRACATLDDLLAFTRQPGVIEYRAWLRTNWPKLDDAVQEDETRQFNALRAADEVTA